MDIQAYIQSGIIESYVLGLASTEEVNEVELLRLQYSEIDQAIDEFSVLLEEQAIQNAATPPPYLKAAILAGIKEEDQSPVISLAEKSTADPVVHITFFRKWRMVAAAAVILLIASAALNVYLYNEYSRSKEQYFALLAERDTLLAGARIYQTQFDDSAIVIVKLKDKNSANLATVSWNTKSKEVLLMANKLPKPAPGKQYQLWAIVNGKPVSAGMLNTEFSLASKMISISNPQAFAITIENTGGRSEPTMPIFVSGGV